MVRRVGGRAGGRVGRWVGGLAGLGSDSGMEGAVAGTGGWLGGWGLPIDCFDLWWRSPSSGVPGLQWGFWHPGPSRPSRSLFLRAPRLPPSLPSQVVAKVRAGPGFSLMMKIQPWEPAAAAASAAQQLPSDALFRLMYTLSHEKDEVRGKSWKKLAKACFPDAYTAATKGDKAAVKAAHKEITATAAAQQLHAIKAAKGPAAAYAAK